MHRIGQKQWNYARALEFGFSRAHCIPGGNYRDVGDLKKAKFHWEAADAKWHERTLEIWSIRSGNFERAIKHWMIASSAGHYHAMNHLITLF